MTSDSELEFVEDSEPEREQQSSFGSRPDHSLSASDVKPHLDEITIPESPPFPSTSRFFFTAAARGASPTKRRRTTPPAEAPSPPSLSREISLSSFSLPGAAPTAVAKREPSPATGELVDLTLPPAAQPRSSHARTESSSSSKRKSGDHTTLSDKEKKPRKKRHSSSAAAGGIVSASALLKEEKKKKKRRSSSSKEGAEQVKDEDEEKPARKSKSKGKRKEAVHLTISSGDDLDLAHGADGFDDHHDIVVPPRLDSMPFHRALYGLPELKSAPVVAKKSKDKVKGKGKEKKRESSSEGEEDGEELDAAAKMRKRLGKHKYVGGEGRSVSRSLSAEDAASDHDSKPVVAPSRKSSKLRKDVDDPPPPPVTLPADERIKPLTSCPLCSHAWTATKTVPSKSTHLLKCARTQDYTSETVRVLVENQLLSLAHSAEVAQRDAGMKRSVFERAVGVGEGANQLREVTVVGVEGVHPALEENEVKKLQAEVDKQRKKVTTDKVVKIAKDIKRERQERDERAALQRAKQRVKKEEEDEATQRMQPRATGLLGLQSTDSRQALHQRAGMMLGDLGGTGLTQLPSAAQQPSTSTSRKPIPSSLSLEESTRTSAGTFVRPPSPSADNSDDVIIVSPSAFSGFDLPSTQPFPASKLVHRYSETKEMEVVAFPPPPKGRSKRKSEELNEVEAEASKGSLWHAAGGKDDEIIRRVVLAPSAPSPPLAAADPAPRPAPIVLDLADDTTLEPIDLPPDLDLSLNDLSAASSPIPTMVLPPSQEEPEMEDRMRTLGLRGREGPMEEGMGAGEGRGQTREADDGLWVDEGAWEDGEEGVLVWEGGASMSVEERMVEAMGEWREDEGIISSSDEEPLMELSRRLSLSAGRKKKPRSPRPAPAASSSPEVSPVKSARPSASTSRRAASPSRSVTSPSSSSDLDDAPPPRPVDMPDYTALPLADLQKQVAKFGFRSSKERSVLVDQLEQVWMATHPQEAVKLKRKPAPKKKKEAVKVVEQEEIESLGVRLRAMVVGDTEMYTKVLRYEPILLDDVVSLAAANSIKVAKPVLMRFLDEQSVTYYSEDPTNGSRRRYK